LNNEKGFTLIEVLAAITILAFLSGVMIMLFSSMNSLWNNSSQKQSDSFAINFTTNTISRELAAPVEVYLSSVNELRFQTSSYEGVSRYEAITYNTSDKSLVLNTLTGTTDIKTATSYQQRVSLADEGHVTAFIVKDAAGTPLSAGTDLINGELIVISITFQNTKISVSGQKNTTPQTVEMRVKLFKE
jgi:prepilin-type N-terminal cleavage/methylation domain-containing protein